MTEKLFHFNKGLWTVISLFLFHIHWSPDPIGIPLNLWLMWKALLCQVKVVRQKLLPSAFFLIEKDEISGNVLSTNKITASTIQYSSRTHTALLSTVRVSVATTICQYQWIRWADVGPQVNKIEQVYSDDRQMSVAGVGYPGPIHRGRGW